MTGLRDKLAEYYSEEFSPEEYWNRNNYNLDELDERSRELFEWFFDETGDQIVDIGCGPGIDMKVYYENGKYPVGVDISHENIRWINQELPDGIRAVHGDALNLPFEDNSFSGANLSYVLPFYSPKYQKQILDETSRVTEPDSLVGTNFELAESPKFRVSGSGPQFFLQPEEQVEELLDQTDFEVGEREKFQNDEREMLAVYLRNSS